CLTWACAGIASAASARPADMTSVRSRGIRGRNIGGLSILLMEWFERGLWLPLGSRCKKPAKLSPGRLPPLCGDGRNLRARTKIPYVLLHLALVGWRTAARRF